jgi:hypothetical protein
MAQLEYIDDLIRPCVDCSAQIAPLIKSSSNIFPPKIYDYLDRRVEFLDRQRTQPARRWLHERTNIPPALAATSRSLVSPADAAASAATADRDVHPGPVEPLAFVGDHPFH